MRKESYENKKFSVLGDSISTLEGWNPEEYAVFYEGERRVQAGIASPEDTWWGKVIAALGGSLLVNNSFSGSLVCRHPDCYIPSYASSDERTSTLGKDGQVPDVVMIFMGTNDWGFGKGICADRTKEPLDVFSEAYSAMLEKIRHNYPKAELWCFTLAVSRFDRKQGWSFPYSIGGRPMELYCEVIRSCAEKAGCTVIDLYKKAEPYDSIDGFHPSEKGMQTIAETVLAEVL